MRPLVLCLPLLVVLPTHADAQPSPDVREGVPMTRVGRRAEACPAPCQVLQRLRIGRARVQVLEHRRGARSSVMLFVRVGGQSFVQLLGGDGPPGFGSDERISFHFDRVQPIEIDGDPATPELVALTGGRTDPSATVCRLAPTPCCLFSMVAATDARGPVAPATDGRGNLVGHAGPIAPRFCVAPRP